MNDYCKKVSAVSLVLALGLATTLFGGTAHATGTAKSTPKIAGEHLVFMQGFNGETPSTALYHLTIKKNNGNAFVGTQRWRECTDIIEKCKTEGATGEGWTETEAVFLVRTSSNTYVLRSGESQGQITVGKKGLTKAHVLGDAEGKVSRSGGLMQLTAYSLVGGSQIPNTNGAPTEN
jgi:hypothetical protein